MLNGKRILSLALALIMICANLPWDAAAAEVAETTVAAEVIQPVEATQTDESAQTTEATASAEETKKEEAAVTDVPAATGASSDEYTREVTLCVPEYRVGDPIPAAQDVEVIVDGAALGEVYGFFYKVGYGEEVPGATFENKDYELRLKILAPEGKPFFGLDTDVICEGHEVWLSGSSVDWTYLSVRIDYEFDTTTEIEEVNVEGIPLEIQPGQVQIPSLTAKEDNVQITSASWFNYEDNEPVTAFVNGNEYYLEITMKAASGFRFDEYPNIIDVNKELLLDNVETDWRDYTILSARSYYSLKPEVGAVEINIAGITPGAPYEGLSVTVDGNVITDVWCYDFVNGGDIESGNFASETVYCVAVGLEPKDGYALAYDTKVTVNAESEYFSHSDYSWYRPNRATIYCYFNFQTYRVDPWIGGLPQDIEPGAVPSLDELYCGSDVAFIKDACWLDENGTGVTQFVSGKTYKLQVTFGAGGGFVFYEDISVKGYPGSVYDVKRISDKEAVVTWPYSLEENTGAIYLTYEGVEAGADVKNVKVDIAGNASIKKYTIGTYVEVDDGVMRPEVTEGVFEVDGEYYIDFELTPNAGYRFYDDTVVYINDREITIDKGRSGLSGDTSAYIDLRPPQVDGVYVSGMPYEIEAGGLIDPGLYVQEGLAQIEGWRWVDEQKKTVTKFEDGKVYYLEVTLAPNDGYAFREYTKIWGEKGNAECQFISMYEMVVYFRYSLLPDAGTIEVTISGVEPGKSVADVKVEVDGNAVMDSYLLTSSEDYQEVTEGVFSADCGYYFEIELMPKDGYRFTDDTEVIVNGGIEFERSHDGDSSSTLYVTIDFRPPAVYEIGLDGLPANRDVVPGTAEVPQLSVNEGEVELVGVRWVDMEHKPVTTLEFGKTYYLELSFKTKGDYVFRDEVRIHDGENSGNDNYTIVDEKNLIFYCYYTLVPAVDFADLIMDGLEVGKSVNDLRINITGKAEVYGEYEVYNLETDEQISGGNFEEGILYRIKVPLAPASGYRFDGDTTVSVNGKYRDLNYDDGNAYVSFYFNTNKKIKTATLNVGKVEVGTKITDAKVTASENANFEIQYYRWMDTQDSEAVISGKFQKGHCYEVVLELRPAAGYAFDETFKITVGSGKLSRCWVSDDGTYCEINIVYSFREKITKVELPAMPTSIKKGDKLSTDYKVSSSAKYTLQAYWVLWNEQETEDSVDENGSYVLVFNASPNDGYEFSDDVVVYVGGKKVNAYGSDSYCVSVTKVYNIGVTEIDRIDLTVPELVVGEKPGKVTCPENANYSLQDIYWYSNSTGDMMGDLDDVFYLQNGLYYYLSVSLLAKTGYGFANEVAVYVNGQKVGTSAVLSYGASLEAAANLGKLGEVKPMQAPAASVSVVEDQSTVTITADANATAYEFWRATSKTGKYTLVDVVEVSSLTARTAGGAFTWQDATATAGKTYYYKVKAVNTDNPALDSGFSAPFTMNIKCAAPALKVEAGSTGKPVLSWNKVTAAKKYEIWRSVDGAAFKKLTTTTKTTYTDSKATNGTKCTYKVKALASSSKYNGGFSLELSCYVTCAAPSLTVKLDSSTGKPNLSWSKVTGAVSYDIYRAVNDSDYALVKNTNSTSYKDSDVPVDNKYSYMMVAVGKESVFNSAMSAIKTVTVLISKTKLTGTNDDNGKPVITWNAVEGAVEYEIYRSTKSTKSYSLVTTTTDLSYTDSSVAAAKTYYYKVLVKGNNSENYSSYIKLSGKCDIPELTVKAGSTGKPVLTWNKISGAKKYEIWRSVDGAAFKKLTTTTKLTYTDSKATNGTECTYKVKALGSSSAYNGKFSTEHSCYVTCAAPELSVKIDTVSGKPNLSWKKVTGAISYDIYRALNDGEFEFVEKVTAVTYRDNLTVADNKYSYFIVAIGKSDVFNSAASAIKTVTVAVGQPKLVGSNAPDGKPVISWTAVDDAIAYKIYRATSKSGKYTNVGTTKETTWTDLEAVAGKTYYYKAVACGANSESSMSSYIMVAAKCAPVVFQVVFNEKTGKPVISWQKVAGAKKYEVFRSVDNGTFKKITTTTKTTYTDTGAKVGTVCVYILRAIGSKSAYNSGDSEALGIAVKCATPILTVKNDAATGKPTLSWKKITGAVKYKVTYQIGHLGGMEPAIVEDYTTDTSYTIKNAFVDMFGWVEVVAVAADEAYNSQGAEAEVEVVPAAPKASGKVGANGKPVISWTDNGDAIYYKIYRSTKSSSGYTFVGRVDCMDETETFVPEFEDETAVKGKTYYYKVEAWGWSTTSAQSNAVKVKSK